MKKEIKASATLVLLAVCVVVWIGAMAYLVIKRIILMRELDRVQENNI